MPRDRNRSANAWLTSLESTFLATRIASYSRVNSSIIVGIRNALLMYGQTEAAARLPYLDTEGNRVSPNEIEEIISGMPGVHEVSVVDVPDEMLGQAIRAFVVRDPGGNVSMKNVLKHCSKNLEAFLVPDKVVFADDLPRSPSGKIDRASLKRGDLQQRTSGGNLQCPSR